MSGFIDYNPETLTYHVSVGASVDDIQAAVNAAPKYATIQFGEGVFVFDKTLTILKDDLTVKGAGEDLTTFLIQPSQTKEAIRVQGTSSTNWNGLLQQDTQQGGRTLELAAGHKIKAGDVIRIYQSNDADFTSSGLYDNVLNDPLFPSSPMRESLVRVASINGTTLTLEHDLAFDFTGKRAVVERHDMAQHITMSDFTITYNLGTPDPDLIENPLKQYREYVALRAMWTEDFHVENVSIKNAASIGLQIRSALEPTVYNFTADGAHNKGDSKNGYGLTIEETFYGDFQHLTLVDQRHAFLFGGWHAEAYNNVQIDYANRDINYHGGPDHHNTVIVSHMEYRDGKNGEVWHVIGPPAPIHPTTDLSQNTNLFVYAIGGSDPDVIQGVDWGAFLDGGKGNDLVLGGAGNDTISGGLGIDTLTGGLGQDRFVVKAGGGLDTLTDFGPSDLLVLQNFTYYTDFSMLPFVQDGDDVTLTLYGPGAIRFQNVHVEDFHSGMVIFETLPDAGFTRIGNDDGNTLTGGNFHDGLWGFGGNDLLRTLAGNDTVDGGDGNDNMDGGDGEDFLTGGEGMDVVLGGGGTDTIYGGSGNDDLRGRKEKDFIYGEDGNDYIEGDEGDDRMWGGAGNDYLLGEDGLDGMWGGDGDDLIKGYYGNDSLYGETGNDTLEGGNDNDKIGGGFGFDRIKAGQGNDRVVLTPDFDMADLWYDFNGFAGDIDRVELNGFGFTGTGQALLDAGYLTFVYYSKAASPYALAGTMLQIDADGASGSVHDSADALFLASVAPSALDANAMFLFS